MMIADTVFSAVQTAIADSDTLVDINGTLDTAITKYTNIAALLADDMDSDADIVTKVKTSDAKNGKLYVNYTATTGILQVYFGTTTGTKYTDLAVSN